MRKLSLGMLGFLFIVGGAASGIGSTAISGPPANPSEALGRSAAQLTFFVVGIVLIVMHFVRRRN